MRSPIDFLLVEEDERMGGLLLGELSQFGITHHAANGPDALRMLAEAKPHGVIVPDGYGLDVAHYAVKQGRTRHILVHGTRTPTREDLNRAAEVRALYLVRPLSLMILRTWAQRVLCGRAENRVRAHVAEWRQRYGLTDDDARLLAVFATGQARGRLEPRAQALLEKTGDTSLSMAVARLHLEIAEHRDDERDDEDGRQSERL